MSYKIDLHTHSYGSADGGLKLKHYKYFLENKLLDYIAVTDHGTITAALEIQKQLGEQIIVGQEIMTQQGEVIGLYLSEAINDQQPIQDVIVQIKAQGGLVYVPHPFETVRSGISEQVLGEIISDIDIIEVHNGRAYAQNRGKLAAEWANNTHKAMASSSDAHGRFGWGTVYSVLTQKPTKTTLVKNLQKAEYAVGRVGAGILYPKLNRLRKLLLGQSGSKKTGTIK